MVVGSSPTSLTIVRIEVPCEEFNKLAHISVGGNAYQLAATESTQLSKERTTAPRVESAIRL